MPTLIIFQTDVKNLHHVFLDNVGGDISFDYFKEMCA